MAYLTRRISGRTTIRRRSFMAQPFTSPSGVYQFRRKVPLELRESLGREYKRSLKTRNPTEAKVQFAIEWAKSEEAFALARAQISGAEVLGKRDIQQLAARWFRAELDKLEQSGDFSRILTPGETWGNEQEDKYQEYIEMLSIRQAIDQGYIEKNDWREYALSQAKTMLRECGIPMPTKNSTAYHSLLSAFEENVFNLSDLARKRNKGDWLAQPNVIPPAPIAKEKTRKEEVKKSTSLNTLFESYSREKKLNDGGGRGVQKTINDYRAIVERFIELCGDLPIEQINRTVVTEFRAFLATLPTKGEGIRVLSAKQQIAKAKAENLPTLSAPTIRNQLRALSAVLSHGVRQGLLSENPIIASGLSKQAARAATRNAAAIRRRKEYCWCQAEIDQERQSQSDQANTLISHSQP